MKRDKGQFWDSERKFDGKIYKYHGWDLRKISANQTANNLRKKGFSCRVTIGKDSTGKKLYRIWKRNK